MGAGAATGGAMARNVALYPWFKLLQNLLFWQAIWFLFFQKSLSASEAILLYAVYDVSSTLLEVPSGYLSDRLGRRLTLIISSAAGLLAMALFVLGEGFAAFAIGQALLGAQIAFASGTDSAMLYESLAADDRSAMIEEQELRAWRFNFAGLAVSAVVGGLLARASFLLPFLACGVAFLGALAVTLAMTEPPERERFGRGERARMASLAAAFRHPVLLWLLALSVLMYGFSHIPFVFGQPFIREALAGVGLAAEAPLVSGAVTGIMMLLSLAGSLVAPRLRRRLGLAAILLLAFAMQLLVPLALALTGSAVAIAFLLLRMVPNALSGPFIIARIQPLLPDESRATYLSLRSFAGRLLFAASLYVASAHTTDAGAMPYEDIRRILGWYVAAGVIAWLTLAWTARRTEIEMRP